VGLVNFMNVKCKCCGKEHPFIESNCMVWTCEECCEEEVPRE